MSTSTPNNPQELRMCLEHVTFGDTASIRHASTVLHAFLRNNDAIQALTAQIVDESNDPGCRQLAAVLLRQAIGKRWGKLPIATKSWVRQNLLTLFQSPCLARPIRYSVGAVLAEVACRTPALATNWPELLPSVQCMTGNTLPELREIAMMFFGAVIEILPRQMAKFFDTFQQVFLSGLGDSSNPVKTQALLGMSLLVEAAADSGDVPPERVRQYRLFGTPLLLLLSNAAEQMDMDATSTDLVLAGLDLLEALAMYDAKVTLEELQQAQVVQLACALLNKPDMDNDKILRKACSLLEELLQCECLNVHSNLECLVRMYLLPTAWSLCRQVVDEEDLDTSDSNLGDRSDIGCRILREMILHLPDNMSVVPSYEYAVGHVRHESVQERRAAVSFLSMIVSDSPDWMVQTQQIGPVMNLFGQTLDDPDCMVRFLTCLAISACLHNEAYHELILTGLVPLSDAMCTRVTSEKEHLAVSTRCCYCLDEIISLIPEQQFASSVQDLMVRIIQPVLQGLQQQLPRAKILAPACFNLIGEMVDAGTPELIEAFAPPIVQLIDQHLRATVLHPSFEAEPDELRLVAAMISCGGSLVATLGKTSVMDLFLLSLMPAIAGALLIDDSFVSASCISSAVCILPVITSSSSSQQQQWIDSILTFAMKNLFSDDEIIQPDGGNELTKRPGASPTDVREVENDEVEDEEDEDEDAETSECRLARGKVVRNISQECKVHALQYLCAALDASASTHLQGCVGIIVEAAEKLLHHESESVREATVRMLRSTYSFVRRTLVEPMHVEQATMAILGCLLDAVHFDYDCEVVITGSIDLVSEILGGTPCTITTEVKNAFMNAITEHVINFNGNETIEFVSTCANFLRAIAPTCTQAVIQGCVRELTEAMQENQETYQTYCEQLQVLQPLGVVF